MESLTFTRNFTKVGRFETAGLGGLMRSECLSFLSLPASEDKRDQGAGSHRRPSATGGGGGGGVHLAGWIFP